MQSVSLKHSPVPRNLISLLPVILPDLCQINPHGQMLHSGHIGLTAAKLWHLFELNGSEDDKTDVFPRCC